MSEGSNIRAIGSDAAQDAQNPSQVQADSSPLALEEGWVEETESDFWEEELAASGRDWSWLKPAIALLAIAGWTGFYGWALQSEILAGGTPAQWIGWIINWSIPVLLIVSLWMLAMRMSKREAARFSDAATKLSIEADALEARLAVVNRELSLAREFLGTQTRELESLGRVASERLSKNAGQLQGLIQNNGEQIDAIASVSDTALSNMTKLRDDLPVVANSARDVSNQVGNAGRTAKDQLDKLVSGFERLNEFGKASEITVKALSGKIGSTLSTFETQITKLEEVSAARFEALKDKSEEFRADLDGREVDALAAMRRRADEVRTSITGMQDEFAKGETEALGLFQTRVKTLHGAGNELSQSLRSAEGAALSALSESKDRLRDDLSNVISELDELDAKALESAQVRIAKLRDEAGQFDSELASRDAKFNEEVTRRQAKFETRESQASEVLAQRLAELDENLAERREVQMRETERLVEHGQEIAGKVSELNTLFEQVSEQAERARSTVGAGIGDLSGKLTENRANLAETGTTLSELTESSIRLLEIIQSGAKQSREDLPEAISVASQKLEDAEARAALLSETVSAAGQKGSELSDYVISTQANVDAVAKAVEQQHERISMHSEDNLAQINTLGGLLDQLDAQNQRLSLRTQTELKTAIDKLDLATKEAFASIEHGAQDNINALADEIGSKAITAVEKSLRTKSAEAIGRLEQAAAHASGVGREAAIQLRDQLSMVNELTGNLEQRVTRARELAEEQVDNDFARRMALISDSLNSNAIDIEKSLSTEVSDTAWASYLKGDRGIFTRRAVRLIDNGEAREIAGLYQADDSFREDVSRYIHDFEGMLRSVLSTRDGNAMGVTLLSSDMGKLYVALAQAIERFRN
ncbi:MAG: ATPase [Erythrobacter sp.]